MLAFKARGGVDLSERRALYASCDRGYEVEGTEQPMKLRRGRTMISACHLKTLLPHSRPLAWTYVHFVAGAEGGRAISDIEE